MLVWVKIEAEVLIGEVTELSSLMAPGATLRNPMALQHINVMQQSQVKLPNRQQQGLQSVTGFKLLPVPCSEIFLNRVDYAGEIKDRDPVMLTYYAVQKQVDEQREAVLVNQA